MILEMSKNVRKLYGDNEKISENVQKSVIITKVSELKCLQETDCLVAC